ncbi:MAG: oligosaccharide flippase family protein, partial [Candidatus Aenigmarchaeota archaeon]|nr:oligosaccharide flippase family protein [Candidatus Aenigmarchaeota archaeon]
MKLAKSVAKNSFYQSLTSLMDKAGALIFAIILARLLQPELFGVYQLALSIGFLFTAFADLGVGSTMIRWVSYALGERDKALVRSYYRYLLRIKLLLLFFAFTILFFASPFLTYTIFGKPELLLPLQIMAAYISLYSFFSFLHSTFLSLQVLKYATAGRVVFEVSRIIIVPVLVIAGFSVWGAILGTCFAIMLAVLVLLFILVKKYKYLLRGETKQIKQRSLLTFLSYLTLSSMSGLFFVHIDSVMLGYFLANEAVGFYKAASAIVFSVIGVIAITAIMLPVFTQLESIRLKNAFRK